MKSEADEFWDEVSAELRRLEGRRPLSPENADAAFRDAPDAELSRDEIAAIVAAATSKRRPTGSSSRRRRREAPDALFPATPRDRLLCGALLDLVHAERGLPITAYLDMLVLLTRPDASKKLLDPGDHAALRAATRAAPRGLFSTGAAHLPWNSLCDSLLANRSLEVRKKQKVSTFIEGPRLRGIRRAYPKLAGTLVELVAKAARALRGGGEASTRT